MIPGRTADDLPYIKTYEKTTIDEEGHQGILVANVVYDAAS